jgi:hypothetical protein
MRRQGAVGIASARLLSSLGVHTFVHSPKEEVGLCTKEEKLYGLSGEGISRRFEGELFFIFFIFSILLKSCIKMSSLLQKQSEIL